MDFDYASTGTTVAEKYYENEGVCLCYPIKAVGITKGS